MYRADTLESCSFPATAARSASGPDPRPLVVQDRPWLQWAARGISFSILVALLLQLRSVNVEQVRSLVPVKPAFWAAYLAYYFAPIAFEWMIFRRLWRIPLAGFAALTRKYVGNEILLGYIGEAYFYLWARQRARMVGAPFGAIKDVAILSAVVGNGVTLAMMAAAYPLLREVQPGGGAELLFLSLGIILLTSFIALLLRRRLFSLPARELRLIAAIHLLRICATTCLAAAMWHLILPSIALGWWLFLASLRLLLSRLPLVPNKDVLFAGLAILAVGHDSQVAAMLAMVGLLLVTTHIAVGLALTVPELARRDATE
jgi:hypothetical protein